MINIQMNSQDNQLNSVLKIQRKKRIENMKISEGRKLNKNSDNGVNGLSFSSKGNGSASNGNEHMVNGKTNGSHN